MPSIHEGSGGLALANGVSARRMTDSSRTGNHRKKREVGSIKTRASDALGEHGMTFAALHSRLASHSRGGTNSRECVYRSVRDHDHLGEAGTIRSDPKSFGR